MWRNEMTDEVFETYDEAVDDISESLYLYEDELFSVLSEHSAEWIFEHLTAEAKEDITDKWINRCAEENLIEDD